jgi:hypothetical protein
MQSLVTLVAMLHLRPGSNVVPLKILGAAILIDVNSRLEGNKKDDETVKNIPIL